MASSDIDLLVVARNVKLKYDIMVAVYREVEAPVELTLRLRSPSGGGTGGS